ncbi:MAG TPA: aldolase/citrate lyase family protein [Chlamydiales bacterium]|nr:aldolase/citrate lyase family protein [Chlamydiales bacterium]
MFSFLLFSVHVPLIQEAVAGGINAVLVDWETRGKKERQAFADTQINTHTLEDLICVRNATAAPVICRLNSVYEQTPIEISQAIEAGANELLLPMVKTVDEVESVIKMAQGKVGVGILVETLEAIALVEKLSALPLSRIYVGLNDLAIASQSSNIFIPLVDGTLEKIREAFLNIPFGFGGLTLVDKGFPIPSYLLMGEMIRLRCHFSFLRRSFLADVEGRNIVHEVSRMKEALKTMASRTPQEVASERQQLIKKILAWNR